MSYGGRYAGRYSGSLAGAPFIPATLLTFDTGLAKPQRTVVIDAMVVLLERLRTGNGGYLQAIEGTTTVARGPEDDRACEELITQLKGRAPSVLISTGDMDFETAGDIDRWKSPLRVHVYFVVKHMRDRFTGRGSPDVVAYADGRADPGVFVAMEHARMLLVAKQPGGPTSQMKELRPLTERRIAADVEHEVWEQIYICGVTHNINAKRDVAMELRQINTYIRSTEQLITDEPLASIETEVGNQ